MKVVDMELDHPFHPAHKLTYHEKVMKSGKKESMVCAACLDEISSEHYGCGECNFFLHHSCAQRPSELTHSLHPLHPLTLLPSRDASCDACRKTVEGFIYYCAICDFDLDFICAYPDMKPDYSAFPGGSKLNHVFHPHILTLENIVRKADKRLDCAACLDEISGRLADYYSCRKCNFFLHKLCAERPQELTHPLHPGHTISLLPMDFNKKGRAVCDACQKPMKDFVYGCLHCRKFYIDFKCALPRPEKRIQNLEQVHPHPLIFIPRTSKFSCDLCSSEGNEDEEEQSYACSTCDYLIHKSCALNTLAQRYKQHQHPLSLVQGVPEDLQIYGAFYCDVCRNVVSPEDSVSHCAPCRSFVHVNLIGAPF